MIAKKIAVLPGDGIGPEVTAQAVNVLKKIAEIHGHSFTFKNGDIGAAAIEKFGVPLPAKTVKLCQNSDAILLGAVGDPKYDYPKIKIRPEQGLLELRQKLQLYANIRPVKFFAATALESPLKNKIIKGVDFIIVRELTGGIYFGKPSYIKGNSAIDTCHYQKKEIERVAHIAFTLAMKREKHVTMVDKANVLATSRLWRKIVAASAKRYPSIRLDYLYVDNAAMQIIQNPKKFDVILTENMFGDILSDEASVIAGSLGMLPSASIGGKISLFEPIHGSYPQAAERNIANPIASILSAAMLLENAFHLSRESKSIETAVQKTLRAGLKTRDLTKKKRSVRQRWAMPSSNAFINLQYELLQCTESKHPQHF